MWRNPKFYPQSEPAEPAAPPVESGRRLATFERSPVRELRVALSEYEGHPYVSLRVWERNADGQWWPVRGAGCSLRIRELPELLRALGSIGTATSTTASSPDLPTLEGTPSQVQWAMKIREGMLAATREAEVPDVADMLVTVTDATWFIANKDEGLSAFKWPTAAQRKPTPERN